MKEETKDNISKVCHVIFHIIVIATLLIGVIAMLTGCGHNVMSFSSGKYLNLGIDPNTQKLGVQYINGEHITVVDRENCKIEVEMKDSLDADGKKTSSVHKITYTIGSQVNGYTVELEEIKNTK